MNRPKTKLPHNELTFQVMVDVSPNALILVNEQGKIVYLNTYAEKLFKYMRSEIIGKELGVLIPKRFQKGHPSFIKSFFKTLKRA